MENAKVDSNEAPDEFTPLLPPGNKISGGQQQDITEIPVEGNTDSRNGLESRISSLAVAVAVARKPDTNQSGRSWTGIPTWLGRIALLAMFLGCATNVSRIEA